MAVDIAYLDFGTSVIGETLKKAVTLTNCGALPATFHFFSKSGDAYLSLSSFNLYLGLCPLYSATIER